MSSVVAQKVETLAAPALEGMGYAIVRVRLGDGPSGKTLQVMIERLDGEEIDVDDCAEASHLISAILDVEDVVPGRYSLEVSSPGVDRPLVKPEDYAAYVGYEIKLQTLVPQVDNRKRFRGKLLGIENSIVQLRDVDGNDVELPFDAIDHAQLVLTDALIAEYLKKGKQRNKAAAN